MTVAAPVSPPTVAGRGKVAPAGRQAPPAPAALLGRLRPAYPARPDAHATLFTIPRPRSPQAIAAQLAERSEALVFPAIVGRFFPGRWATRPPSARRSRRGLVRWLIALIRAARLFPLVDQDLLDEADWDYGVDDSEDTNDSGAEDLPPYCYVIPVEGGYPYVWVRALWGGPPDGSPSEALLYVLCGNPTRHEEEDLGPDEPDPVADARRRVRGYLAARRDRRLAARVWRLVRVALATSRRYGYNRGKPGLLCGLDHAVLTDLGGVFAGRPGPLGGVPTLAAVMARSTGNCFIDVDELSWCEMGYDQQVWSVEAMVDLVAAAQEERELAERAYTETLHPLRADPAFFPALVDLLGRTLRHYRAHARAHGEPDPAAPTAWRAPGRRRRLRHRRRRP